MMAIPENSLDLVESVEGVLLIWVLKHERWNSRLGLKSPYQSSLVGVALPSVKSEPKKNGRVLWVPGLSGLN